MIISILLPDLRGGGAERVMVDLAREFSRLGHTVEFVLMRAIGSFLAEAEREFKIFDLATPRTRNVPPAFAGYLRDRKPDAVIANMWPLTSASVVGKLLSRQPCRLLLLDHTTLTQSYADWGALHANVLTFSMAATYRFADCVAAVSQGAAESTAKLARLPVNRVKVLHNPIPQKPFPSLAEQETADTLWACPRGKRILTVGTLKVAKNHPLLLRSFASLALPDARLMLLGEGEDENESELKTLASELGIANRVIFAGFHPDPAPFYATADLFVLSSNWEGLPTVLIEALSLGLPVVSTDCPSGPSEILQGGRFGELVPVGDAAALAKAMEGALTAEVDREALIRRAADFAPEIAAQKYLDLLGLK
ncbi:MAG: glycosyltransferase [Erythrobacter sp.]